MMVFDYLHMVKCVLIFLATLPSLVVFYFMVCRVAAKKRKLFSFDAEMCESWAYLLVLGGSVATWFYVLQYHQLPHWDKLLMDSAVCLYFCQRNLRIQTLNDKRQSHGKMPFKG
ncbi:MAG: hypothetical protein IJR46_01260 [Neisseriaceae bacterium]|nr:hypothetical protein [Neisseriaceae bacterium]